MAERNPPIIHAPRRGQIAARQILRLSAFFLVIVLGILVNGFAVVHEQQIFQLLNLREYKAELEQWYWPNLTPEEQARKARFGPPDGAYTMEEPTWSRASEVAWTNSSDLGPYSRLPKVWPFWSAVIVLWGTSSTCRWAWGSRKSIRRAMSGMSLVLTVVLLPAILETAFRRAHVTTLQHGPPSEQKQSL